MDKVRKYAEELELADAVERAIRECIAEELEKAGECIWELIDRIRETSVKFYSGNKVEDTLCDKVFKADNQNTNKGRCPLCLTV